MVGIVNPLFSGADCKLLGVVLLDVGKAPFLNFEHPKSVFGIEKNESGNRTLFLALDLIGTSCQQRYSWLNWSSSNLAKANSALFSVISGVSNTVIFGSLVICVAGY